MAVKFYCDICGNEIENLSEKYTLSVSPSDINSIDITYKHICVNCLKELKDIIKYTRSKGGNNDR